MSHLSRARAIRRAGVAGVALAVAAILFATQLLYRSQQKAAVAAAWVDHTHLVIESLHELQTAASATARAQREAPRDDRVAVERAYAVARDQLFRQLARVADSTRDNPAQQRRIAELHALLQHRFEEPTRAVGVLGRVEPQTMRAVSDSVRRTITAALGDEHALLAAREAESRARSRRSTQTAALALALGLAVVLASFGAVRWESIALADAWRAASAAERAMAESEQRYKLLFASSPRPSWVYDVESLRFLAVNPAAVAFYGHDEAAFLAMTIADIRPAGDREQLRAWVDAVSGEPTTTIRRHVTRGGVHVDMQLASHPLEFAGRRARLVVAEDVTDRQRREAQLADLAVRDTLTGLLNRRGFEQLAGREIAVARRTRRIDAALYLDLDAFKPINDSYGHAEGDVALRAVADVLRGAVREHDVVARLGGDELVVYAVGLAAPAEGHVVAERLQAALAAHNARATLAGRPYRLAFSVGVAELQPGDSLDTLLARADVALYAAKQARLVAA